MLNILEIMRFYLLKNLGKNDVLIELCPLDADEFMELANEVCVLPPKSTFFIPKFPSFLVFKKYK